MMKFFHGRAVVPDYLQGTVATIGNFDGVHLGHQALIRTLVQAGRLHSLPTLVVVFEPQPGEYFLKNQSPIRLTSLREKLEALQQCGVDFVHCLPFNNTLANMSATAFAKDILEDLFQVHTLMVGKDFRFGKDREGDIHKLQSLNTPIQLKIFEDYTCNNQRVSSTLIREALANTDLTTVKTLLGRPYSMCGRVVYGEGRGRQLNAPTANILLNRLHLPLRGVYIVTVEKDLQQLPAVANIGYKPTFNGVKPCLEVHLLNWQGNVYGQFLKINFLQKVRDEIKFASLEALKSQIQNDINQAQSFFTSINSEYDYGRI